MKDWVIDVLDLIGLVIACLMIYGGFQIFFGG